MSLRKLGAEVRKSRDWQALIDAVPYAGYLGLQADPDLAGFRCRLPFTAQLVGNQQLPALHGGLVAGLLEATALFHLMAERECLELPRPIDFTIDYLRSAGPRTSYARCEIVKLGRRICNVRAKAWQDDETRPFAIARGNVMVGSDSPP
ncbi:MAG: PaaI family thioesterase [Gammaproteobacteria bacterium]|nr:PaaI family thioesterase [Gammaproteobacteria bacterium]